MVAVRRLARAISPTARHIGRESVERAAPTTQAVIFGQQKTCPETRYYSNIQSWVENRKLHRVAADFGLQEWRAARIIGVRTTLQRNKASACGGSLPEAAFAARNTITKGKDDGRISSLTGRFAIVSGKRNRAAITPIHGTERRSKTGYATPRSAVLRRPAFRGVNEEH
jgi:hypothetical protein